MMSAADVSGCYDMVGITGRFRILGERPGATRREIRSGERVGSEGPRPCPGTGGGDGAGGGRGWDRADLAGAGVCGGGGWRGGGEGRLNGSQHGS